MRGRRAFVVLTAYLVAMSIILALIYVSFALASGDPSGPQARDVGKAIFGSVVAVQVFLVLFIAPAFTAGAISGEKERRTYDLLRTTLLSPQSLVGGKLLSALGYVLLLVFASVPLQSIAFMLGGISAAEVFISQLIIIVAAIFFALVGMYASSAMRSTLASSVATYAFTIFLTVGVPVFAFVVLTFSQSLQSGLARPGWVAEMLFGYFLLLLATLNLPASLVVSEVFLVEQGSLWGFTESIRGHNVFIFSPWYLNLLLYSLLAFLLYGLTVRRVGRIAAN